MPSSLEASDNETEQLRNLTSDYQLGTRWLYGPADGVPLFTDNETNGPAVWGPTAASASPFTKDAFHRHIVHGEAATNPVAPGHEGVSALSRDGAGRADPSSGAFAWRRRCSVRRSTTWTRLSRCASAKPTNSTRRFTRRTPPTTNGWCSVRRWLGCCGSKQVYLFDVQRMARRGRSRRSAAGEPQDDSQRPLAASEFDAHPVDARQVGVPVVRRMGPRVPLRRAGADRSGFREGAICGCCCSSSFSTRTVRSRRTSGSSRI